jgi:hypothetical protein
MVNLDKLQELNKWWAKGSQFYIDDVDLIKYQQAGVKLSRKELLPLLRPGSIIIVKGPRRAGKTIAIKLTIMKLLSEGKVNQDDILYFSFDEAISSKEMENVIRNFLNKPHSGSTYVFLDEIQAVKGWASVLLGLANSGILKNTSILVTGSIAHFLGAETLPGRGTEGNIYYLRTFSFRAFVISLLNYMTVPGTNAWDVGKRIGYTFSGNEIKSMLDTITQTSTDLEGSINDVYKSISSVERYFLPLSKLFDLYINTGGYPLSVGGILTPAVIMAQFYEEIYNYIKNDAATITSVVSGDPLKAGQVVSGVLRHIGEKISYSKIAQQMSMNKATLINYSNRLENSFVFLNITGMKSLKNELKESEVKKFYFSDVFMHYSAGAAATGKSGDVYSKELINSSAIGLVVEEIVADHLIRVKEIDPMKLYGTYLRFYDGNKEIDFIYKKNSNKNLGIEVKYQGGASLQDIKMVDGIEEYVLLTKSSDFSIKNNCAVLPVCLFLAVLQSSEHNL